MAIEYNFKYMPLVGKLSGKSMAKQTETAINEIAKIVNDNTAQAEIINTLAEEANTNSVEALEKANEALETSGRVYIKETGAVDLDSYCESQLIYINNIFSQNLPVESKGFLEVKTNDDKTQATQVFTDDVDKKFYIRTGTITAQQVGDVTNYIASYGDWEEITNNTYLEEYVQEELRQHGSLPVGYEYFSFNPNIPQGCLPLFGGEYSRATYSDLWTWVQTQTGYLKTEAQWQSLSTANAGNVPYYSDGDGSTTFRVPSLKCWIKGANGTVSEVGSYLEAGLPNITTTAPTISQSPFGIKLDKDNPMEYHGALGISGSFYLRIQTGGTGEIAMSPLLFKASNSNSIYGNSTTVQPESIVGLWLVKAYGVIVDTGQIDEQQYIDDRLATKLSLTGGTMLGAIKGDSLTLTAENGGNSASLILNNSGSATWNSKEIERVNASGTNYIRYESGLQMCFGSITTSGSAYDGIVTYPVPFISNPSFQGTLGNSSNNPTNYTIQTKSATATGISVGVGNGSVWAIGTVRWLAIGYWK